MANKSSKDFNYPLPVIHVDPTKPSPGKFNVNRPPSNTPNPLHNPQLPKVERLPVHETPWR